MRTHLPLILLACLIWTGCVTTTVAVEHERALLAWEEGERSQSVRLAKQTYHRFRRANDLEEHDIEQAVIRGITHLEEVPTPPLQSTGPPMPEPGTTEMDPDVVARGIRADLMSLEATAVFRAIHSVGALQLRVHAPALLLVIFRTEPFLGGPGPLEGLPVALQALALKRLAVDVLEGL